MKPILDVHGVCYRAGATVILQGVSFSVRQGELVALMGRNGAGKSTLLDVIAGLRAPSTGDVAIESRSLASRGAVERARLLGHLPQSVQADSALTVEQLVSMGRYPHADTWFESEADCAAAEVAMAACGCLELAARNVATLSGGERQRVLLAACLAQRPRLLLLDEPATFLDIDQQVHCFEVLRGYARGGGACLVVTHDINLALMFCTRLVVLAAGSVAYDGATDGALDHPEWLQLFSSRLAVARRPEGRPWVYLQ